MKGKAVIIMAVAFTCLVSIQRAYAWGSLTHAYITSRIVQADPATRDNAIYGSTAADFANYMFGSPYQNYLMNRAHTDFLKVWRVARGGPMASAERAAAYGFVAHNEEDYTAHSKSLTLNPQEGYVIQKAAILNDSLAQYGAWQQLGLDGDEYTAVRAELCHDVIEFAGDLFVALYLDPGTGQILSDAANQTPGEFPKLIFRAYAGNLVAYSNRNGIQISQPAVSNILAGTELEFRGLMILYGDLYTYADPDELLYNLAVYLQTLAKVRGIEVDNLDLVAGIIGAALGVIQTDFAVEISSTIEFVEAQLAQQDIAY